MSDVKPAGRPRWRVWVPVSLTALVGVAVLGIGAFPVGALRGVVERRISATYGAPVHVGAIERDRIFSFSPIVSVRDLSIGQPEWAGTGQFLHVDAARVRVPVIALLLGRGFHPDTVRVSGLVVNLIRRTDKVNNWSDSRADNGGDPHERPALSDLIVENSRFTLRDERRALHLAGTIAANAAQGLVISATGSFKGSPASMTATGGRVVGADPAAPWPFRAHFAAPILSLDATGTMNGPLNTRDMALDVHARGTDLKYLDALIEAGLFGTQAIDLTGKVRHLGRDWYVDRLSGTVGRSQVVARATVLKVDDRTKIDATIHASQFDFDDLADNQGLAEADARRARIGKRIIPDTRINLSKMGPTDGTIRFMADRLLFKDASVFRSLSGVLTLDHRDLRIGNVVAGMTTGRMTGSAHVDSRSPVPTLSTDLRFDGATLERLIGSPDNISGAVRAHVRPTGRGNTVREAMAHASGKAAMVATSGQVKRTVAHVLGQDLSGAIGDAINGNKDHVPLRCLVADFRATNGVLVPSPLAIDTGVSVGRGSGRIVIAGETIALTLTGATKGKGVLRITDPIRIGGTLTDPRVTVAGLVPTEKPRAKAIIKVLGRSIGAALGLRNDGPQPPRQAPAALNCAGMIAAALN